MFTVLSIFLFSIGLLVVVFKRHALFLLMGIELMLNAANVQLLTVQVSATEAQTLMLFIILLAVCEAAIGIALVLKAIRYFTTTDMNAIHELKEL